MVVKFAGNRQAGCLFRKVCAVTLGIGLGMSLSCSSEESELLQSLPVPETKLCTGSPQSVDYEVVASNLEVPWGIESLPDARMLVTERPGRVRVIEDGALREEPWTRISVASEGVIGLTSIVAAPDYQVSGLVYVAATFSNLGSSWMEQQLLRFKRTVAGWMNSDARFPYVTRVIRFKDHGGFGVDPEVIIDGIPADPWLGTTTLRFGPDGLLYVSTGYAAEGKILRYTADGEIPADNPWPNSPVFAYGFRQSQGLAWDHDGHLFATEHGTTGNDELNIIRKGENYGWPVVTGLSPSDEHTQPIVVWGKTIAPAGLAV
ncbi:MAG: PQQ-dependent sugar dehydrogenase, partial [Deltaproteobacteria bacterium]|nr:PQQ-dependent sugar dehydrogenase [Deltaproteobacteria bacterium]